MAFINSITWAIMMADRLILSKVCCYAELEKLPIYIIISMGGYNLIVIYLHHDFKHKDMEHSNN